MIPYSRPLRVASVWLAAAILGILPIAVAADYGGVLRWTHYVIALAVLVSIVASLPSLGEPDETGGWRRHGLMIPLLLWIAYASLQLVPLPTSMLQLLSPGSAEAYTEWITPYLASQPQPERFPISVAPYDSWHVIAMMLVLVGVAWASAQVFSSRIRVGWLLCLVSVGASLHVFIGFWRMITPDSLAWAAIDGSGGHSFGAFVNRNNAALLFNLGLAASLGLLSWRLTAMTGLEVDDPTFEFNDLFSLVSHRESAIGVFGAAICLAGILVCGSRGGLVAALAGSLLAFGWVRQRRGFISMPVVGLVIVIAVACLVVPFHLELESLRRFEFSSEADTSTVLRDGRLQHWRDGLEAGMGYLPSGSGLSTYAYAHLPYKKTGPHAWYHHADNLWLELLVEQGVIGIILGLFVLVAIVRALNHLGLSHDPLDQGLRITGWYAVGAILVSQAFDFGLIIPANLLVVIMLMASVLSRGAINRLTQVSDAPQSIFAPRQNRWFAWGGATVALVACLAALPTLRRDAEIESAVRQIQADFEQIQVDPEKLQTAAAELKRTIGDGPSPPVATTLLSDIDYRLARISEVLESRPQNVDEMLKRYRQTGAVARRLQWWQPAAVSAPLAEPAADNDTESMKFYQRSLDLAGATLIDLPLDMASRTKFVYLDFVHRDPNLTRFALRQLRQMYRNNPEMLMRLGVFAADSNDYELAIDMWRSAITQEPAHTARAIQQTEARPQIAFTDVVPPQARNLRAAARVVLDTGIENDSFLTEAKKGIDCDSCRLLKERADCEELAGDIEYKLGQMDEAFASYSRAIQRTPANIPLRLKLIRRLIEQGRYQDARREARRSKELFPDAGEFPTLLDEIAKQEIREINSRGAN